MDWKDRLARAEAKLASGEGVEDYDIVPEMAAEQCSTNAKTFARRNLPPSGIVDYSQLPASNGERFLAVSSIEYDLETMADLDFDLCYHETKERMRSKLAAWQLLDEQEWCADELLQVFELAKSTYTTISEFKRRLENAQIKGSLGITFTSSEGIRWLLKQKIAVFSDFKYLLHLPYEDTTAIKENIAGPSKYDEQSSTPLSIPGKIPARANGQLAIKAAWEIEGKLNRRSTDKEVMKMLCEWADTGKESHILKESAKNGKSVVWITSKGGERTYSLEALGKTLESWKRSRN